MKKINYFSFLFASIFIGATALVSCSSDEDDPIKYIVSPSEISLSSEKGASSSFNIMFSNGEGDWTITTFPEFVEVYPKSGTGNGTVRVTAKDNNDNEYQNEGMISVKVSGAEIETQTIKIAQGILDGCDATPANELILCQAYAYIVSCGPNTKYFYQQLYTQNEYNKMSEKEVIADVVTGKVEDRDVPSNDNYYSWSLSENSKYVLVIVPFAENDRQGKPYISPITTKFSETEPDVDLNNFSIDWSSDSYEWNVTKNTYCAGYYTYAVASKDKFPTYYWMESGAYGLIGWAIRAEIDKNGMNHAAYINQDTWSDWGDTEYTAVERFYALQINDGKSKLSAHPYTDQYIQIVVWGTKANNDLSGVLHFGYADWSSTDTEVSKKKLTFKPYMPLEHSDGKLQCMKVNMNDFQIIRIK